AKVKPKAEPTGGYLGRRREPMFVREGDSVWLLWERKASQAGGTSDVSGHLAGRRITEGRMDEPVILAQGWVDYRVAHDAAAQEGAFPAMASTLPRDALRRYFPLSVKFTDAAPLQQEEWLGWTPVKL